MIVKNFYTCGKCCIAWASVDEHPKNDFCPICRKQVKPYVSQSIETESLATSGDCLMLGATG